MMGQSLPNRCLICEELTVLIKSEARWLVALLFSYVEDNKKLLMFYFLKISLAFLALFSLEENVIIFESWIFSFYRYIFFP